MSPKKKPGKGRKKGRTRRARRTRRTIPDPKSVVSTSKLESPSGRVYRIVRTTQTDPYDAPQKTPIS